MADQTLLETEQGTRAAASPRVILAIVGFAVFVAADDLTVVTTMLRPITNDLGLTLPDGLDDAAWIVNVYLIAFVAIMPLAGRLSDVIGRRRLFFLAYAIFTVGTIVIPLSNTLAPFFVGRVLTAIGGGAMVPVALAVVGDVFRGDERARALGTLGAIETLGWVWGPLYGALLVRFLDWRWQFWLNIPLAIVGAGLIWWALPRDAVRTRSIRSVDWIGAVTLSLTLIALDLALLGNAEIQSVSGLAELQGGGDFDFRLLYPVAIALGAFFFWHQRRTDDPLVEPRFYTGRNLRVALFANLVVGAALVIAMVDVPIFVNAIEIDLERSAVIAGWMLAALTAAMTAASYLGGRLTFRTWYQPPIAVGLAVAIVALVLMGLTWTPSVDKVFAAAQLALLGAGLGLVFAPSTAAVVDASPPEQRGAAASVVMVVRLIGLSVGLAGLTAWGLARFNSARASLELPSITDPGFEAAVLEASAQLTSEAIAETFLVAAAIGLLGLIAAAFMRKPPVQGSQLTWADSTVELSTSMSTSTPPTADPVAHAVTRSNLHSTGTSMTTVDTDPDQPQREETSSPSAMQGWMPGVVMGMAVLLAASLVGLGVLYTSLQRTQDDLDVVRADLVRVEEGAAGSAIVAAQVLDITRQLAEIEPTISSGLDEAIAELEAFGTSELSFQVPIDETVKIDTEVALQRTFSFPIDETITIDQEVETTIEIDSGLGFSVPVDVKVPVNVDVPVKLDVDVPVDETLPINLDIPVKLDVPIVVSLAGTELEVLTAQLAEALRTVQALLAELS